MSILPKNNHAWGHMVYLGMIVIALCHLAYVPESVSAHSSDPLNPVSPVAPALGTWPEHLLTANDFAAIEGRVIEARNSGAPLAVRIVDLSAPIDELPDQIKPFATTSIDTPMTNQRMEAALKGWVATEHIESQPGADDGILLLVLVRADRTSTQAVWWIGTNALPHGGLTQQNIVDTLATMQTQFDQGLVALGVYNGISEFSYNVQFGTPDRLTLTGPAALLHKTTAILGWITLLCGVCLPVFAWWRSRRNNRQTPVSDISDPWQAAALHLGRAKVSIGGAMLFHAVNSGQLAVAPDGRLLVLPDAQDDLAVHLRCFATSNGALDTGAMRELDTLIQPLLGELEDVLAESGAMTPNKRIDRDWMLLATGITGTLAAVSVAPSVRAMSEPGIIGIVGAAAGILIGWWWLAHRRYTSPAGELALHRWLESASPDDLHLYELATNLHCGDGDEYAIGDRAQEHLIRRSMGLGVR